MDNYQWDYYAKVTFLQADADTREKEYHLVFDGNTSATDAMIETIKRANNDLTYGDMILAVEML